MTKRVCPSCHSERCGNWSACERRSAVYHKWRDEFSVAWGAVGVIARGVKILCEHTKINYDLLDSLPSAEPLKREIAEKLLLDSQRRAFEGHMKTLFRGRR
jgi:hypothetical protein